MSRKLTKHEVERLIAALDELGVDDDDRLQRLRAAAPTPLVQLLGREAPWPELIDAAAATAGWPADRVRRLRGDSTERFDDAIDAIYELITELNETRRL